MLNGPGWPEGLLATFVFFYRTLDTWGFRPDIPFIPLYFLTCPIFPYIFLSLPYIPFKGFIPLYFLVCPIFPIISSICPIFPLFPYIFLLCPLFPYISLYFPQFALYFQQCQQSNRLNTKETTDIPWLHRLACP